MPRRTKNFESIHVTELGNLLVITLHGPDCRPQRKDQLNSKDAQARVNFVRRWQRIAVSNWLDFEIQVVLPGFFPV